MKNMYERNFPSKQSMQAIQTATGFLSCLSKTPHISVPPAKQHYVKDLLSLFYLQVLHST